jgi:predicted TIM-barrel fold metal-dependent hydrolase
VSILDAHVHLWEAASFRPRWTQGNPAYAGGRGHAEYRALAAPLGIAESVIVEIDVDPAQRRAEAEDQAARQRRGEVVGAVPCLDPREPSFIAEARALASLPGIRGVRWIARSAEAAASLAASPHTVPSLETLGSCGLFYELQVPPADLLAAAGWVARVRGTRIVLDHCGNGDPAALGAKQPRAPRHDAAAWRRGIDALARLPHVACKISGIVSHLEPGSWSASDLAPVVDHCLDAFGPERVLFGSDWPVCTAGGALGDWMRALHEIVAARPAADRERLFGGNARRWMALPPPG